MAEEKRRKYRPIESKLVFEWMMKTYPRDMQWRKVRLGPLPKGPDAHFYSSLRRWCDGVIATPDENVLVEAKVKPDPGAISQLMLYAQLFPKTPEFTARWHLPIKLIVLTTLMDEEVKALAEQQGMEYAVYSPKWIKDYWKERIASRAR